MVKVIIGSLVICHLIVPGQQQSSEGSGVLKVLGEVVDINKGSRYIEQVEKKTALEVDTDVLIIKGKNKEGMFQVDARACMAVRKETEEERMNRVSPPKKKVVIEEEVVEGEMPSVNPSLLNENTMEEQVKPAVDAMPKAEPVVQDLPKENSPMPEVKPVVTEDKKPEVKIEEKKEEKVSAPDEKKEPTSEKNKGLLDYLVN